jgi:L-lactate dehydrogenase complex protein LldF
VRRRLPHADARGAHAPEIPRAGAAPRRGARRRPPLSDHPVAAPLRQRADGALHDSFLQQALTIATTKFIDLRREAFAGFPEGEALRDRARAIKEATLQQLDHHLETLVGNIERLGGHVHYAANAEEARRIVIDIARRAGARMAVKSKSMATEEIDLNEALEREGITPVETDLGEYIIQLAHERPSHIIAPAIHKTKGQVAELFARELKRPVEADPEELTRIARAELRQKFLQADIGITGANFAVADTGTVVLVTNEGNGRMVTSLPRVHVAVMGAEKVVPSMTDLMVFLAILAKSATGQKLSVYTTLVRGPRRAGELEGPEEFHLVLLDSGRIAQLGGPLREALSCLRCGACLNVCPVYRQIGGHAYGHTYPGPIGILLTAMLEGTESVKELAHASSLCGACADACPVRIDIPKMLIELRREVDEGKIAPWIERVTFKLLAQVLARPALYRLAARVGRILQRPFARGGTISRLPLFLGDWTRTRDLPPVAARTFQERWAAERETAR